MASMSATEKAKIRKWILTAVASGKSSVGVTIQTIKKFLDSKQDGLSSHPEMKLMLKRLLETGHLGRKDGKYVIRKPKKKMPVKDAKRLKLSPKSATGKNQKKPKSVTKKPKQIVKSYAN